MNAYINSDVCVINTSGEYPCKAWVPLVFIGTCKHSDNYNRYLKFSIVLLDVDPPRSGSTDYI